MSDERFYPQYQFEPYVDLDPKGVRDLNLSNAICFANTVRDVVMGAESLVRLLEWDASLVADVRASDSPSEEQQPVLDEYHRATLTRLLAESLRLLVERGERHSAYLARAVEEVKHG